MVDGINDVFELTHEINDLRKAGDLGSSYEKVRELFSLVPPSQAGKWESRAAFWTLAKVIQQAQADGDSTLLSEARKYLGDLPVDPDQELRKNALLGGEDFSSREVFRLKREGMIDEAYEKCLKLRRIIESSGRAWDRWEASAAFSVLSSLIHRACSEGSDEKLPEYRDFLMIVPVDEEFKGVKEHLLVLDSTMETVRRLSKEEKYDELIPIYLKAAANGRRDDKFATAFAWDIFKYGKFILSHTAPNCSAVKRLLAHFCRFCSAASIESSCAVLALAKKLLDHKDKGEVEFNFAKFFELWNPKKMPEEYWNSRIYEGRRLPPEAVSLIGAAARDCVKNADKALCEFHLPYVLEAVERCPSDSVMLVYRAADMLLILGRRAEAEEYMLRLVRSKSTESWAWNALGGLYAASDPDKAAACWCRGLSCFGDDKYKVRIKNNLLKYFLKIGFNELAAKEAHELEEIYSSNQWKMKSDMLQSVSEALSRNLSDEGADNNFYLDKAKEADEVLFEAYPWIDAVVAALYKNKDGKSRVKLLLKHDSSQSTSCPIGIFGRIKPKLGEPVKIKAESTDKGMRVLLAALRNGKPWDVATDQGVVLLRIDKTASCARLLTESKFEFTVELNRIAKGTEPGDFLEWDSSRRNFAAAKPKEGSILVKTFSGRPKLALSGCAFVDDVFIPPPLVSKFNIDEEGVATGTAVISYDRKKDRWSYSAVRIDSK